MNATKSLTAGLLLVLLLALGVPTVHAQLAYEPALPTLERLDHLTRQQAVPLSHGWNDSLWYFSQPGQRPTGIFTDGFESGDVSRLDANGDGTNEITMIREDSQGNPTRFIVYDMIFNDTLFVIDLTLPDYAPIRNGQMRFEGFYDFIGEGTKAATFGGGGVIIVDPADTSHPAFFDIDVECRYAGVSDFNDDNKQDLVIRNRQARRIEIYTFFAEE